jgi:hypothetical protein
MNDFRIFAENNFTKMLRNQFTLLLFILFGFLQVSSAQVSPADSLPQSASTWGYTHLPLHKLHIGIRAGTEFMTTSGYGSGFSTFLSPTLTYPVSTKFQLSGGISIVNTSYYGLKSYYSTSEGNSYSGDITQAMLWVSGQYLLGNRITITGTAYKTFDILGAKPGSYFYKNNPQGAWLNVGYKISDHMQIEAGFGYSQGSRGYSCGYPGIRGFGSSGFDPFFNR